MATAKTGSRLAVKVDYNPQYDTLGEFPTLNAIYSQTFNYVKETATTDQIKAFVDALMSLTIYNGAPYKIRLIDTGYIIEV